MAESVNSPLLNIVPVDSLSVKNAKNADSAPKSSERDSFSQVLDDQRGPERADARNSSNVAGKDSGGKKLPPDGNSAAERGGESAASDVNAAAASSDENSSDFALAADQNAQTPSDSVDVLPGDEAVVNGNQADAVLDDAKLGDPGLVQGIPPGLDPAQEPLLAAQAAKDAVQLAEVAATTASVSVAKQAAGEPLSRVSSPVTAAGAALLPASDKPALAALSLDGNNSDAALSPKPLQDADALPKGVLGNGTNSPPESTTLNRSTVDWLRGGAGSDSLQQRVNTDFQFDAAGELARSATPLRGDNSAAAAPASSTIAAMTPAAAPANASAAVATTSSGTALPEYALSRAPDDAQFPGELTARMKTLLRDGVREARLQLHPAELGRLQVTVTTEGDQTKVVFTAETAAAREAIEQSMPKLREMLEQSGLQLAQSDVGQRDFGGEAGQQESEQLTEQSVVEAGDADPVTLLAAGQSSSRIDTYI